MAHVVMYTRGFCGFCRRARKLLERKGVVYDEIDIWKQPERFSEMVERSRGGMTVPQIFIDDVPIGGSDELVALERSGTLDALLAAATEETSPCKSNKS